MDIQTYINSGIIEEYCLGLLTDAEAGEVEQKADLYPEIRSEIEQNVLALENYGLAFGKTTQIQTRQRLMQVIDNLILEEEMLPANLPLLNAFSSFKSWTDAISHIQPPTTFDNIYSHTLINESNRKLYLVWVKSEIPEEDHPRWQESLLLLDGNCKLITRFQTTSYEAGRFVEIPAGEHWVQVTSNIPLKFILQRIRIVA